MERVIINGDYVPDGGGGLKTVSGGEEVLARVLFRLTARRGALPFLPQLGSRLYELAREKPSARQSLAPAVCGRGPAGGDRCECGVGHSGAAGRDRGADGKSTLAGGDPHRPDDPVRGGTRI